MSFSHVFACQLDFITIEYNHYRMISYLLAQTNIPPTDQFTSIWPESGVDLSAVLSGFVETQLISRHFSTIASWSTAHLGMADVLFNRDLLVMMIFT